MGIFDFLKKDKTPRLFRTAIKTAGENQVKQLTLNGIRAYWIKDVRKRKKEGLPVDPGLMMEEYNNNLDPEWEAMLVKVGITHGDIYSILVEVIEQGQDEGGPIRKLKTGRNDPCPCGSGLKYKKCCGR